jgi:hypothetical protein
MWSRTTKRRSGVVRPGLRELYPTSKEMIAAMDRAEAFATRTAPKGKTGPGLAGFYGIFAAVLFLILTGNMGQEDPPSFMELIGLLAAFGGPYLYFAG